MSEDLNIIRNKLIDIVKLVKELHEILIKLETKTDIEELDEDQT